MPFCDGVDTVCLWMRVLYVRLGFLFCFAEMSRDYEERKTLLIVQILPTAVKVSG